MSLHERLEKIRSSPVPQNEESAKFQILARILEGLGWNPYEPEEVLYEHSVGDKGSGRVDIALKTSGHTVALIEAKAPHAKLSGHVGQVLGYAFYEGVDICVLTTGLEWWLYLPRESGEPSKRRFAVLKIMDDSIDRLSEDLHTFLSKETLSNGHAVDRARLVLKAQLEEAHLNDIIPSIWQAMLKEPDDELVELISRKVYGDTNIRPSKEQVLVVLRRSSESHVVRPAGPTPTPAASSQVGRRSSSSEPERESPPSGIEIWGQYYPIKYWKDVTIKVAEALYERHSHEFDRMLQLRGSKHPYVSLDPKLFGKSGKNHSHQISSSGFYIYISLARKNHLKRAQLFLNCFGYPESDLKVLYD